MFKILLLITQVSKNGGPGISSIQASFTVRKGQEEKKSTFTLLREGRQGSLVNQGLSFVPSYL